MILFDELIKSSMQYLLIKSTFNRRFKCYISATEHFQIIIEKNEINDTRNNMLAPKGTAISIFFYYFRNSWFSTTLMSNALIARWYVHISHWGWGQRLLIAIAVSFNFIAEEEFRAAIGWRFTERECWNKAHHKSVSRTDFCRRSLNLIRTPSRRVAQRACGVERTRRQLVRHLPSPQY